jgi:hypothetical protein
VKKVNSMAGAASLFILLILGCWAEAKAQLTPDSLQSWYLETQLGLMLGEQQTYTSGSAIILAPTVQLSAGRYWNPHFHAGLGAGFEQYGRIRLVPLYAQFGGNVWQRRLQPFYLLRLGTALAGISDDGRYQHARGGWLFEGQAGLRLRISNRMHWLLASGYRYQVVHLSGRNGWSDAEQTQERRIRRVPVFTGLRYSF